MTGSDSEPNSGSLQDTDTNVNDQMIYYVFVFVFFYERHHLYSMKLFVVFYYITISKEMKTSTISVSNHFCLVRELYLYM